MSDVDDDFAAGGAVFDFAMSISYGIERESAGVNDGPDFANLSQAGGFAHDIPMVLAALAGQHRQEGENAGVSSCAEG
jgi:hypothetical protein